jgi:predicted O-linked N-acetylglucosamine transferase (SPINDLY family)
LIEKEMQSEHNYLEQGYQRQEAGLLEDAIACYQKVLSTESSYAEALLKLAEISYLQNHGEDALTTCYKIIFIQPNFAPTYKILGNVLQSQGKLDEAIRAYNKALELDPNFVEAMVNLGSLLYKKAEVKTAIELYKNAMKLKPDLAALYWNLGKILQEQGQLDQAFAYLQKALELEPTLGGINSPLIQGYTYQKEGKLHDAIKQYQHAIASFPDDVTAYLCLGSVYLQQGEVENAIGNFQTAIQVQPHHAEAHNSLGLALLQKGKTEDKFNLELLEKAIKSFLVALEIKPNLNDAYRGCFESLAQLWRHNFERAGIWLEQYSHLCETNGNIMGKIALISSHLQAGDYAIAQETFLDLEKTLLENLSKLTIPEFEALYFHLLFNLPHLRDNLTLNTQLFREIGKQYREQCAINISQISPKTLHPKSNFPLRIGFLSPHFRRHSVGWCSYDVIEELSKITPDIYCYVTGFLKADDLTEKFKAISKKFYAPETNVNQHDSEIIIKEIIQDKIDILIDLDSITVPTNIEIIQAKPAPVCISWLGFDAPFISEKKNYFIGDDSTHPVGTEKLYTEKVIVAPDSFIAVSGFSTLPISEIDLRKSHRIGLNQIVYLSVASGRKLNPDLINAQIKILKQVPDSILLYKGLQGDRALIYKRYQQECVAQGVSFHRVKFLDFSPTEENHRLSYIFADIMLDSYPYNEGTHSLEALWFETPIVTRVGEQYLSRMGYSFLKNLGINTGIAQSWEEYIEWGVKLGKDENLRKEIKEKLGKVKEKETLAPLWNPKKLAEDLYSLFLMILAKQNRLIMADRDLLI